MDVLPTVFGCYDWAWTQEFRRQCSGTDALAGDTDDAFVIAQRSGRPCEEDTSSLYALTTSKWRYHLLDGEGHWLFDRTADPYELRDCAASQPEAVRELQELAANAIADMEARYASWGSEEGRGAQLDEKTRRELESLGYTGGTED